MISKSIHSLGLELECGMDREEYDEFRSRYSANPRCKIGTDGSVDVADKEMRGLEIRYWSEDKGEIYQFLHDTYGIGARTNNTCGFHLHVKFTNLQLGLHMVSTKNYQNEFISRYKENFPSRKYQDRLKNHYSSWNGFDFGRMLAQEILYYKDSSRYYAVNINPFKQYKTIEFRIFPYQYNDDEAIKTLEWFLSFNDEMFASYNKRKEINAIVDSVKKVKVIK